MVIRFQIARPRKEVHSYQNHKYRGKRAEYYIEQDRKRAARNYAEKKLWLDSIKSSLGCQVCGESEPCALDFHHLDESLKSFPLSSNNIGRKREIVLQEIAKCALVCSNCHRKIHNKVLVVELNPIDTESLLRIITNYTQN